MFRSGVSGDTGQNKRLKVSGSSGATDNTKIKAQSNFDDNSKTLDCLYMNIKHVPYVDSALD